MKLPALAAKHKVPLLVGGAGLAVVAGLRARAKGGGAAGKAATPQMFPVAPGGTGYYDSTASDLYNAIHPQLESLQRQIEQSGDTSGLQSQLDALGDTLSGLGDHAPTPAVPTSTIIPLALPQRVGPSGSVMDMPTAAQQTAGTPAAPAYGYNLPSSWALSPASSFDWLPNVPTVSGPGGGTGIDPRYPVSIR